MNTAKAHDVMFKLLTMIPKRASWITIGQLIKKHLDKEPNISVEAIAAKVVRDYRDATTADF